MAYYSGVANDLGALRQALIDACVGEGWVWNGSTEFLSKNSVFIKLTITAVQLRVQGFTGVNIGASPNYAAIGRLSAGDLMSFPVSYELFIFDNEVYVILNYDVEFYQWLAFGKSALELPGTGAFFGATIGSAEALYSGQPIYIDTSGGGGRGNQRCTSAALFFGELGAYATARNCWIHSGFDSTEEHWLFGGTLYQTIGILSVGKLLSTQPNSWNSEAVLLPLRAYKIRRENKVSLIADLAHARHIRVDNYGGGEVIKIGAERWKVFPWYRKNSESRNGGGLINHSGTFGWAIRYDGP